MSVTLTEKAAQHVEKMLKDKEQAIGLRLSTRKSGCSGYAYQVDYAEELVEGDHVYDSHGIKIVVNDEFLEQLDGISIDYVKQNALNEGFEFSNPNVKDMCGCGESVKF